MRIKATYFISTFLSVLIATHVVVVSGAQIFGGLCAMPAQAMSQSCCSSDMSNAEMSCCDMPATENESSLSCLCSFEIDSFTLSDTSVVNRLDCSSPLFFVLSESECGDRKVSNVSLFFDSGPPQHISTQSLPSLQRFLI